MIIRIFLLGLLITATTSAICAERLQMNFELTHNEKILERGKAIISMKLHTLNKGLKSSYLKLNCRREESEKILKLHSTVDLFAGMQISHQIIEDKVQLKVVKITVQPRLTEIRALTKNECKDMSPIVNTTAHSYSFPAVKGINESRAFGDNMIFRATFM